MRIAACALSLSLVAGCKPAAPEPPPSTALVLTDLRSGTPLDEMLHQLDQELIGAVTGQMEGESVNHLIRAEAITDRLLEANLPFEWLTTERYSLQARLRQIQSEADRVMALWKTGAPAEQLLSELQSFRTSVIRLRQLLASGGGRAPPPLHLLLTDTIRPPPEQPARPPATAPAARPVPPDTIAASQPDR